jgi:hypothetical protein
VTAGTAHVTLGHGGGFGNNVQVQIGDLWVRYAHLEAVLVSDGDLVAPGTVMGLRRHWWPCPPRYDGLRPSPVRSGASQRVE